MNIYFKCNTTNTLLLLQVLTPHICITLLKTLLSNVLVKFTKTYKPQLSKGNYLVFFTCETTYLRAVFKDLNLWIQFALCATGRIRKPKRTNKQVIGLGDFLWFYDNNKRVKSGFIRPAVLIVNLQATWSILTLWGYYFYPDRECKHCSTPGTVSGVSDIWLIRQQTSEIHIMHPCQLTGEQTYAPDIKTNMGKSYQ